MSINSGFQLNIYTIIILFILLVSMFTKRETYKVSTRMLRLIMLTVVTLLVIEIFSWMFDGIDKEYAYTLNYIFNTIFFVVGVAAAGLFTSYIDYMNFRSKSRLKKRFYYMHMAILALILAIINIFTPIIFSISAENVYSREPLIAVGFISVYLLLVFMLVQTFKNRKKLDDNQSLSMYVFILLPFIGGVLQLFFFGLLIMWAFSGLGVLIAYIFNETTSNSRDYLTKLFTREITYSYMESMIEKNQTFIIISIDIDDFKNINDSFGHKVGDEVLFHFSKILSLTFGKNALVSRFGGDEFVVVIKEGSEEEVIAYHNLFESNITLYKGYRFIEKINFSFGSSFREIDSTESIDDLLEVADDLMYDEKAQHKNRKRRITDK